MGFSALFSFSACTLIPGVLLRQNTEQGQEENNQKAIKWPQIKHRLSVTSLDANDIHKIISDINKHGLIIQNSEVLEVIDCINSLSNSHLKLRLLQSLGSFLTEDLGASSSVRKLALSLAASEDRLLAPAALGMLIESELTQDKNGEDQWETWQWSEEVKTLLEESTNKAMYKLPPTNQLVSPTDPLVLLRLFNRYPDSRLTEGARLYRQLTDGEPYIGGNSNHVLRLPLNPKVELEVWPKFLLKYPDHPASDEAMYRMARAHELQGEYTQAAMAYYRASKMPDGGLKSTAMARSLFVIDFFMDSKAIGRLIENVKGGLYQELELLPILEYSRAVSLIRENNISLAILELEEFLNSYQAKIIQGLIDIYENGYESTDIMPSSRFWSNLREQIEDLKKLQEIRRKPTSDKSLYEEAALWFHNYLLAYNYLWRGQQRQRFEQFIPNWEGVSTSVEWSMKYEFIQAAIKSYNSRNGNLISIALLQRLIESHSNSSLLEKSKYSIILNYYWLYKGGWDVEIEEKQAKDWASLTIKSAYEFVEQFPTSSMADDALLTVGEIADSPNDRKALEKLLKNYPNSDRKEAAKGLLEAANHGLVKSEKPRYSTVVVGIQMNERKRGLLNLASEVSIHGVLPDSPAAQSGLLPGDILLEIDEKPVSKSVDVRNYIRSRNPGEIVRFKIKRGQATLNIETKTVQMFE